MPQRSDLFSVSMTVTDPATGETRDTGVWDARAGGGSDSSETNYNAAGGQRLTLGGPKDPDNVTLSRLYDLTRDFPNRAFMLALVGRGDTVVTEIATDASFAALGQPLSWRCKLKRYTPPDYDSNSNDPAKVEVELTVTSGPNSA